jgi:hypothetical protein
MTSGKTKCRINFSPRRKTQQSRSCKTKNLSARYQSSVHVAIVTLSEKMLGKPSQKLTPSARRCPFQQGHRISCCSPLASRLRTRLIFGREEGKKGREETTGTLGSCWRIISAESCFVRKSSKKFKMGLRKTMFASLVIGLLAASSADKQAKKFVSKSTKYRSFFVSFSSSQEGKSCFCSLALTPGNMRV